MMRGILVFMSFISTIFSPWIITAILVFAVSLLDPLVPLAIGLFADTLYYTSSAETIPLLTLYGAIVSLIASFVRNRLSASIIME
jgi:hypothetical protein